MARTLFDATCQPPDAPNSLLCRVNEQADPAAGGLVALYLQLILSASFIAILSHPPCVIFFSRASLTHHTVVLSNSTSYQPITPAISTNNLLPPISSPPQAQPISLTASNPFHEPPPALQIPLTTTATRPSPTTRRRRP